jgi:RNA polymerase sigma-70 factor (ECF subfamily)
MDTSLQPSAISTLAANMAAASFRPTLLFSAMPVDEFKTVAASLRRRDPGVVDRLIEQYQYRLFRYLLYLTANRERAEDFFQETWIRVLERGHQYDGRYRFEAWLFSIARNLVIDWQRQKKMRSLEELAEPESGEAIDFADENAPSPLRLLLTNEESSTVQASLSHLPVIHREVLLLRFQEDLPLGEIATVLGVPLATVKSRLYRGLEGLRTLIAGQTT